MRPSVCKSDQYPAPRGPYKVQVNAGAWRDFPAARFQISMKNPKHAGAKFYAQCEWAAQRFGHVQLVVSDTLHRHNIMASHGAGPGIAWRLAERLGDSWMAENAEAIALLPSFEVTRWDQWLFHPDFAHVHAQVAAAARHGAFAVALREFAHGFVRGREGACAAHSENYLVEEIAVFAIQSMERGMVDIRPGSPLKRILDLAAITPGMPEGVRRINSVVVDFVRNGAYCAVS